MGSHLAGYGRSVTLTWEVRDYSSPGRPVSSSQLARAWGSELVGYEPDGDPYYKWTLEVDQTA